MITLKNIQTIDGQRIDKTYPSEESCEIDGTGLTIMPAAIDPHVHFRTPGAEHKESWITGAKACVHGGYTHVFDMPNNVPACSTVERLEAKMALIEQQLKEAGIPLRYHLYFGADRKTLDQIPLVKDKIIGVKIFMGSSTGDLLMDKVDDLRQAFEICGKHDILVAVHAEDECLIQQRMAEFKGQTDFRVHSKIRSPEVAEAAVKQAIDLAREFNTRLYILHVSTINELELIRAAKSEGLKVYAEACPHHLFMTEEALGTMGARAQMNPPLRSAKHQMALWQAIQDGSIDTIGSDHAPHSVEEKNQPYGKAPSGVPNMDTSMALLLNAYNDGRLSLERIVELTRTRAQEIFRLPDNDDVVLVDLHKTKIVDEAKLYTRCGWSPYAGWELKGWPSYTICQGKVFTCRQD
ncbi:MAG: dihydroorotase [Gammaproteobacteria bacterium]|nr:dihydroorotase [Gammaproteobacteria bacterium]